MEMKWTITLGELLQVLSLLFGGFALYSKISARLQTLEVKIQPLWDAFLSGNVSGSSKHKVHGD